MNDTNSPTEENVQSYQTTNVESGATETTEVQSEKNTTTTEGQEGVKSEKKESDIEIPTLPEDMPEEGKKYIELTLQKAQREMQKAFTKKTQEIANLKKENNAKLEEYDKLKEYIPILEELKNQREVVDEPDFSNMSDDERLQHMIRSMVESEVGPYKEKMAQMKASEIDQESKIQEDEARQYAETVGVVFDDYAQAMIDIDSQNPGKYTWKQLLRIVAGDEIDNLLLEKGKLELVKSLQKKKAVTPPESRGGEPATKINNLQDAIKESMRELNFKH